MPERDDHDRCDKCGKRMVKDAERSVFVDLAHLPRRVRACVKCSMTLRATSGYKEL